MDEITALAGVDPRFNQFAAPSPSMGDYEKMKEIRLCVNNSDVNKKEIPEGSYYLCDFNIAKGEPIKTTLLGETIAVNILRNAMKVRKWDNNQGIDAIQSTEFQTFNDHVVLYDTFHVPNTIIAALPYQHKNKMLPTIGGRGPNALKAKLGLTIRYVSYVLFRDEVCRFNWAATDNAGAVKDGQFDKPLEFGKEAPDSFLGFVKSLPKGMETKLFLFNVTLGSKQFSNKLILKTFKNEGQVSPEESDEIFKQLTSLYEGLEQRQWNKYTKAREATDLTKLDGWSKMILDRIDKQSTNALLRSATQGDIAVSPVQGVVIDVPILASAQAEVDSIASDLGGEEKKSPDDIGGTGNEYAFLESTPASDEDSPVANAKKAIRKAKDKAASNGSTEA